MTSGRAERSGRIAHRKSGAWGTSSQDVLMVAAKLARSRQDGNTSRYVYGGIPLLLAATHSFIIEYEAIGNVGALPSELYDGISLARLMETRYGVSGDLLQDLRDLTEIRNEIIHPAPLPAGTRDNWPDYLRRVKQKGLLNTTGDPEADFILLSQIASHALFKWAVEITKQLYAAIVYSDLSKVQLFLPILDGNFRALFGDGC
jgi:hypothetical protein